MIVFIEHDVTQHTKCSSTSSHEINYAVHWVSEQGKKPVKHKSTPSIAVSRGIATDSIPNPLMATLTTIVIRLQALLLLTEPPQRLQWQ